MEKKQKKEYIQILVVSVLIVLLGISIIFNNAISRGIERRLFKADIVVGNDLVIHFINVGQGDAIAIKFPNQQVMLIDCGPKMAQNNLVEYIKDNVKSSNNNEVIDYLILTHSDIDHSGGTSAIFVEFEVKTFFRPNIASESENVNGFAMMSELNEYDSLIKLSKQEQGIITNVLNKNYHLNIAGVTIDILSPLSVYDNANEMSPVIKISYKDKSFLFVGDLQGRAENDMIDEYGTGLEADVLKVSHHGSDSATSYRFINVVNPDYAVICVGDNSYGHPSFNTIARLEDAGAMVVSNQNNALRFVCSDNYFGLLNDNAVHSYETVNWWIIALTFDIVLGIYLIRIITVIYNNKSKR